MMLMIPFDDAVDVALRLLREYGGDWQDEGDLEFLRSEMEQKAWLAGFPPTDPVVRMHKLICDINPEWIAEQIKTDNLIDWCESLQAHMELALVQMKGAEHEAKNI